MHLLPWLSLAAASLSLVAAQDAPEIVVDSEVATEQVAAVLTEDVVRSSASLQARTSPAMKCCLLLKLVLGDKVAQPGSAAYDASVGSYWATQNREIMPTCVVAAGSAFDVALAVAAASTLEAFDLSCPFAVRSGGHAPAPGLATRNNGFVIDLSGMKSVTVSGNKKTALVGAGNRWIDVYNYLNTMGLAVTGGRVGNVGVGGLTTGGGISFFSTLYGFACDTVSNFQVVLANGFIVNANANTNSDLFWALKGGANNFGVVTRFDYDTFPLTTMWGGSILYGITALPQLLPAFVNFAKGTTYDPKSAIILSVGFSSALGNSYFISSSLEYAEPIVNPPAFQPFTAIQPQLFSTMRITTLPDLANELSGNTPAGKRQIFFTTTYKNDLVTLTKMCELLQTVMQPVTQIGSIDNFALSLEPVPTIMSGVAATKGGNALGVDASDGDLIVILLGVTWNSAGDDQTVISTVQNFFTQADNFAKSKGTYNPFQYINYAYTSQKPIASYGAANVNRLKTVANKYDSQRTFQDLVSGFKLNQ